MYAIISDGGRQYKVEQGQRLQVDYREASTGDQVKFDRVLALGEGEQLKLGTPVVEGAVVTAEVVGITQGEKLEVQKFRRRKTMRRRTGHRQMYTEIQIREITG